ncbi:hypothetical protein AAMO2058_000431200 [Amorphochlora amoebiformis]
MADSDIDSVEPLQESELRLLAKLKGQEIEVGKESEGSKPMKKSVLDVMGLESKLKEIALPANFHWVESLSITTPAPYEPEDIHDDLKREAEFFTLSLQAANIALKNLKQMNIPFERPEDFYAEMVKTDSHMAKVKTKLLTERKKMDATEKRKKEKQAKKFAKQVHAKRLEEKARAKKKALESVKTLSQGDEKARMQISWLNGGEVAVEEEDGGVEKKPAKGRRKKEEDGKPKFNKKRAAANAKYGFGGKKRRKKANDFNSAADMSSFNPRVNSKSKGSKKKKGKRPGKNARRKSRG